MIQMVIGAILLVLEKSFGESMTRIEKDQKEQIYEILLAQYKDAQHGIEYLTDKAQNLLGFDGVINSILVAIVVLIVKDQSTRELLSSCPYFTYICATIYLGLSCYILSVVLILLLVMAERKPVPRIESSQFIKEVCEGNTKLNQAIMSLQIFDAIRHTEVVNRRRYRVFLVVVILILIAIVCTAIIGILVFTFIV